MLKNTCIDFKFEDGDSVQLTLAFYAIYQLKAKNKQLYDKYNRIMTKGAEEELDMITILYVAYLCANINEIDSCMTYEQFLIKCGSDRKAIKDASVQLTQPKKQ